MEHLLKSNRKIKTGFLKKLFFGIVVLLVAVIFYFGKLSFLSESLHFVGRPIWEIKNYSAGIVQDIAVSFQTKNNLIQENKTLKNELAGVNFRLLNLKTLRAENAKLKEILGRKSEDINLILATVIAKPGLTPYGSLILDRGRKNGIKTGDKVLADANIIIGEIIEVNADTSKVKLYSFPGDKISVAFGFDRILAQAEGKGNGNFEIELPQGTTVALGDIISLPETESFMLGVAEEIIEHPDDLFQTILFKNPINIFELRWVQIIQE